jgi:hypothetical protein
MCFNTSIILCFLEIRTIDFKFILLSASGKIYFVFNLFNHPSNLMCLFIIKSEINMRKQMYGEPRYFLNQSSSLR